MNKKIIAAAIAASFSASVAIADVTVGGHIEQGFATESNNTTGAGVQRISDVFIKVSASEDLGNGMKAFGHIRIDTEDDDATSVSNEHVVGLSGDFGTVMTGRFEAFIESKLASTMSLQGLNGIESSATTHETTSNGIAYVSPSFNGLTVGAGAYAVTANEDDWDATEIAVMYSNGPLSLAIAQQNSDSGVVAAPVAEKVLGVAASYTMDNMKFSVYLDKADDVNGDAANDQTDVAYRFDYTMGNNKITLGYLDDETTNGADGNDTTAIELLHSFSKNTSAYVGYESYDSVAAGDEDSRMYVGLQTNF